MCARLGSDVWPPSPRGTAGRRCEGGLAMPHGGINRRPDGAPVAARGRLGGVTVAEGTRRDVRRTWGGRGSNGDAIHGHRGQ